VDEKNVRHFVFLGVIVILFLALLAVVANIDFVLQNLFWILLVLIFLVLIWQFDFLILMKDYQRAVIYRFGKVNRVGGPGWAIVLPPIETYDIVDLRTQTVDVPKREVITADNIELEIDSVIYLKVKKAPQDVINSVVEVENYKTAVQAYVVSMVRDIVGSMPLSEVIANIDELNAKLTKEVEKITTNWGIDVEKVVLRDVEIPRTVIEAMHMQKAAVQQKLARVEKAEAHKIEINAVKEAAAGLDDKALSYYYIKALEELGRGKSSKIIFPMEFSKIAEAISDRIGRSLTKSELSRLEEVAEPYKEMLKEYIDKAVKKAKGRK